MKELFKTQSKGVFWVEKEGEVYSRYNILSKEYTYIDSEGDGLEDYSRSAVPEEIESARINDTEFFEDIGEGFYVYTTHNVTYDPDGAFGLFGIKYNNGEKLTDEVFRQVDYFRNGYCSVSFGGGRWGCINRNGRLAAPYKFSEPLFFNQYGVAVGDHTLIDTDGEEIPDTALNCIEDCDDSRYFVFGFLSREQMDSADECGASPDVTVDIYDTKNRNYVVKGIPEYSMEVYCFDGEPEVIRAAAEMLDQFDKISLRGKGTILGKKNGSITVFDYYQ